MKKLYALLTVLASLPMLLSAQITITQSDMPSAGDTIKTKSTVLAVGLNYTNTGNNHTWDFHTLVGMTNSADTFVNVTGTPLVYQIAFTLPFDPAKSNLASPQPNITLGTLFSMTKIDNFYRKTSTVYQTSGFGATIFGIPIPIKFDNPDIWYHLPVNATSIGTKDSSNSLYSASVPGLGYLKIARKRVNYIDGWGSLILPAATYNVIRIKSVVQELDSLYIDSLSTGIPINRNYTEYKWLTNGKGIPVLQVTNEIIATWKWIDTPVVIGVNSPESQDYMTLYPNPAAGELKVDIGLPVAGRIIISVFDVLGNQVYNNDYGQYNSGNQRIKLDLEMNSIKAGIYVLRLTTGNKVFTSRFVVR